MKKIISLFLVSVMFLGIFAMSASADSVDSWWGHGDRTKAKFYLLKEGLTVPVGTASEPTKNYDPVGTGIIKLDSKIKEGYYNENGVDEYIIRAPEVKLEPGQSIIWYVIKDEKIDGWHVDGVVTPFYSFVYDSNGTGATGTTEDGKHYYKDDTATIQENAFVRDGYEFTGWNTASDGSGIAYAAGDTVDMSKMPFDKKINVVTLYAQWKELPTTPVEPAGEEISLGIVTPKKMSVRFEDGTVYYGGESIDIEIGKEYRFQMCSNNWDNDTYSDDGNGICGTVVYTVKVSDRYDERSYDPETKTFVLPKGDPVLRTDVNKCFMAYRYHFEQGDYNKQTGIKQVVNTPLESLSVNLPLGSTIKSDAYIAHEYIDSADVFIENNNGVDPYDSVYLTCVNDYYWKY